MDFLFDLLIPVLTLPPKPSPGSSVGIVEDSVSDKGGDYA